MKVIGIIDNDIVDSMTGFTTSLWLGGCPIHCNGCHNKSYWDPEQFPDCDPKVAVEHIVEGLTSGGFRKKNFSILGGEPLAPWNKEGVLEVVKDIKYRYSDICIYLWTGYLWENLKKDPICSEILKYVTYLIDGPYKEELKDRNLRLRGSSNQRLIDLRNNIILAR